MVAQTGLFCDQSISTLPALSALVTFETSSWGRVFLQLLRQFLGPPRCLYSRHRGVQ